MPWEGPECRRVENGPGGGGMSAPSSGGASRDGYGAGFLRIAGDPRVVVIEADLGKSTKLSLIHI